MRILKSLITHLTDLVYPPLCLLCDTRLTETGTHICTPCLSGFTPIGKPHEQFSISGDIYLDTAWALFEFDESFQQLIHHLKYSRRRKPVLQVLDHYKDYIMDQLKGHAFDSVISIPLHPTKHRERGYNQVDDLTRWLSSRLGVDVGNQLVRRDRYTQTQTKLTALERQQNVEGAFSVKSEAALKGKHVLLVDDVLTTGATANAMAGILKSAGAKRIDLLTLSTPPHGNA